MYLPSLAGFSVLSLASSFRLHSPVLLSYIDTPVCTLVMCCEGFLAFKLVCIGLSLVTILHKEFNICSGEKVRLVL